MTGAQIYFVSACTSGEEFVSAFRRYADRNGVIFIPVAEPLPAGRRGRFALTLVDGGVMVEGQAEIVSSARTPSVLHGRVGMTVKFLVPDDPSKAILADLEKARTALKPGAPSVAPRPAELPAAPRPKAPPASGRIDSVNALAQCVVVGDVSSLSRDSDLSSIPSHRHAVTRTAAGAPLVAMPKAPSGAVPVAAPRTPSSPIAVAPSRFKTGTIPPPIPAAPSERLKSATSPPIIPAMSSRSSIGKATTLGVPAIDRRPASGPLPVVPAKTAPMDLTATMRGPAPGVNLSQPAKIDLDQTMRGTKPAAPLNIAPPPPIELVDELTDLTAIPPLPGPATIEQPAVDVRSMGRRTELGIAIPPSGRDTLQMEAMSEPDAPTLAASPKAPIAPIVEEASGDWIMTPGDTGPTIQPRVPEKKDQADIPSGPPTGNWTIALDPSRADGWSEPSKVDALPYVEPGPPKSMVSSVTPLDSDRAQPHVSVGNEPKIQIDPTLIESLGASPLGAIPTMDPDDDTSSDAIAVVTPQRTRADLPPSASSSSRRLGSDVVPQTAAKSPARNPMSTTPGMGPFAASKSLTDGGSDGLRHVGHVAARADDPPTTNAAAAKRRTVVLIAGVVGAIAIAAAVVLLLSGRKDARATTDTRIVAASTKAPIDMAANVPADAAIVKPVAALADAQAQLVMTADGAVETPAIATADAAVTDVAVAVAPRDCRVTITSAPRGAEVLYDNAVMGTTPTTLTLPCGSVTKVILKKRRYQTIMRSITPTAIGQGPVKITLPRVRFSVKVSSTPPGATIFLGTRSLGVTPTTVKLPAFETSMLTISKDGYVADTQSAAPKNTSLSIHAALKRAPRAVASPKRK